jgi:hypothetical protein
MSKFSTLTSVNMTSLRESVARRAYMTGQMYLYGIPRHEFYLTDRWTNIQQHSTVEAKYPEYSLAVRGTAISHLEMMRHWYISTDEPYAIFCDDDIDFSTSKYWNFTWEDFLNNLPSNWECVQLVRGQCPPGHVGPGSYDVVLKIMYGRWWGTCALMSRSYVKKCLDRHIKGWNQYNLRLLDFDPDPPDPNFFEYVENVLYLCKGLLYNYPLLSVPDPLGIDSTYTGGNVYEHKLLWKLTRDTFYNLWETQGRTLDLKDSLTI